MAGEYESRESYNVAEFNGDPIPLVSAMKHANEVRRFPDRGTVWWIHSGAGSLFAGVRGDRGLLTWMDGSASLLRPHEADNRFHVDYFTSLGAHFRQGPFREVSIERVFDAVCDFVRTGKRPTCIDWIKGSASSYQGFTDSDTLMLTDLTLLSALPEEMRTLSKWPRYNGGVMTGRVWMLLRDSAADSPLLFAGVRGNLGYLAWRDGFGRMFVPSAGQDPGGTYETRSGSALSLEKGSEVPVRQAIQAVVDFTGWRCQPTSIAWQLALSAALRP